MKVQKAFFATTSLCTGLLLAALAGPVLAQDQSPPTQPGPGASPPSVPTQGAKAKAAANANTNNDTEVGELVVTGSRIKTTNYSSAAPMTTITAEQAQLTGSVDTAQILQLSAVAANAVQINNYFSGFVTTGGPGVNTLSLRGLGADRTLILINGERLGPAGVGGTVGPIDLNVIPESMIDHIDILKDGASSIYGSDAVAGVVNIVTKTNEEGFDVHGHLEPSQYGGGNTYQFDASYGKTFDRGYVSAGFDYYRQDPLTLSQRSYLNCSRDLVNYASGGGSADIIDPATGQSKCWNEISNAIEDLGGTPFVVFRPFAGAVAGGGVLGSDQAGWQNVGLQICKNAAGVDGACGPGFPTIDVAATRYSHGLEPENDALFEKNQAVSPVSRYTFSLFGGYDLTPHAQLYGSVLLNQRDSAQDQYDQFFTYLNPGNPSNDVTKFGFPLPIIEQAAPSTQTVDYGRFVLGVKGDLPSTAWFQNWTYDVFGQFSRSDGSYTQEYVKQDRVEATAGAGAGSGGCDVNSTWLGTPTMAQLEPGVKCVPVNYIAAAANGGFTPAEAAFLYANETGHTIYDQEYLEGSATGNLIQLPAGPLGAAVGFHVRRESIDDVPGQDFQTGNVYNYSSATITKGSETVEEVFGEFKVPIVKDLPALYSLDIDVSGRYSNYSDFGGQGTYKGTVDWKVTDWLPARATYGTAFRAPALFELYVGNLTGYLAQVEIDPCIDYATSGVSPVIQKNCAAQGIPGNYAGAGSSATILSGGGAGHLKAENSVAETVGFVLTPKIWNQEINFTADYYAFDIDNEIAQFGASNILTECYGSISFPSSPFCSLFTRDLAAGPNQFQITTVNDDFVNLNKELDQGIDVDINWRTQLPHQVKFTIDADLDWTLYHNTFLLSGSTNNYLGSIGYPRFVGNMNYKFERGPWTFNWEVYMIGHASDNPFTATTIPNYRNTGQTVTTDYVTPFYSVSNISIRRRFDKFTVIFGVKNLFNEAPPAISYDDSFEAHNIGTSPAAVSQYDLIGRAFYFDVDAKF